MKIAKKIINEVAYKMLDNRIDLEDIAIVPNVYLIYLHTENHTEVKYFLNTLREQIIVRLDKEVEKRNGKGTRNLDIFNKIISLIVGSDVVGGNRKIIAPEEWDITFQATDRDVLVGDIVFQVFKDEICIVASFTEESVGISNLDSILKTSVTKFNSEGKELENHIIETAKPTINYSDEPADEAKNFSASGESNALAVLECKYMGGDSSEIFAMTEDKIIIGRDPNADFVLRKASNKISRKHLEITFREEKFFLRSFGFYGTTLNGKKVPLCETVVNNSTQELDKSLEIPDNARIALSGGEVLINFTRKI